jgi:hypothetical protein
MFLGRERESNISWSLVQVERGFGKFHGLCLDP